ncbi:MAG: hypothetical protein D6797_06810, partial [Bdellovibrio sp.]
HMKHQVVDQYLIAISKKYQAGSKNEKSYLLDHAQLVTKRSRKQLIRRLRSISANNGKPKTKGSGRPLVYSRDELIPHIRYL